MKTFFSGLFLFILLFQSCAQNDAGKETTQENNKTSNTQCDSSKLVASRPQVTKSFTLADFLSENKELQDEVETVFKQLSEGQIIAQLIMPAVGKYGQTKETIEQHIKAGIIGGVLMLNGTKDEFTGLIKSFEAKNKELGNLPFLYSADAEPSLVNRKINGSTLVKKASEISSYDEVVDAARTISNDLNAIGINYNFAPVVDVAGNATVGYRGFGSKPEQLIPWSNAFIQETQKQGIIATAKHFPGHGLVSGDTHKSLQMIDGELKEIKNYPELIKNGVLSIMVAHIAVQNNAKYNTNGLPSTCSEKIVTDLLRKELGFKGLIVTDAMNMGGVVSVPQSATKAIQAGCDIVLMPLDAKKTHVELLAMYKKDESFRAKVQAAAMNVIRMKICLGLLK
ncbi:MAG: glycoside hydrolase family 3 protein [Bacteroidetes bacterium]|nr:glycoside hydrolase family 3 protein [Bacteroidota bacterium]